LVYITGEVDLGGEDARGIQYTSLLASSIE
jgi:hypothetical protein